MASGLIQKLKELEIKHYVIIAVATIIFVGAIIGIFNYRQGNLGETTKELEIYTPISGEGTYYSELVVIEGKSKPNTKIVVGELETQANDEGLFSLDVPISIGENNLKVVSSGTFYKSEKELTIYREELIEEAPIVEEKQKVTSTKNLNNTGPETLWALEAGILSGSVLLWGSSRKKFKNAIKN